MTTGNSTTIHTFTVQNTGTRDCMDITRGRANNRLFVFERLLYCSTCNFESATTDSEKPPPSTMVIPN